MPTGERLLDALTGFYADSAEVESEARAMLRRILARLKDATPRAAPEPRTLVSTKLWEQLLCREAFGAFPNLDQALKQISPSLYWQQNPNYSDESMGAGYMDNYGYAALVGGEHAFFDAEDIRCGLLLLGPHRHYPIHHHAAEEVYCVLASEATQWRRGEEDWRTYPLGAPIYHAPWVVHETKTASDPLLALYCWYGESENAVLIRNETPNS